MPAPRVAHPKAGSPRAAVHVMRTIPAPREEVFRAWTEPEQLIRWFTGPLGTTEGAEMDVRPGGTYRIDFDSRLLPAASIIGTYLEVEPPERLVCTFAWEGQGRYAFLLSSALDVPQAGEESRLTVEFRDRDGSTEVRVTHELLEKRRNRAFHRFGWNTTLANLARLFARSR
jgi:uncharacterized protein YndB with AHSA1/START domain